MLRRLAVFVLLATLIVQTTLLYELIQHVKLGAVSLALMATQTPSHAATPAPAPAPRSGVVFASDCR